ncbi:acetate--CoA ligase family protein [Thermovirga lienii]|jgi:acyl-CoA synthetase (NDP forming)|uniref:acetate--CoA ligase family protein n=1 Tax=Thermovirga lienii TaxID=336261 RepID=UPI000EC2CDCF|nr:CoA-binding protein [Thermovirga lienii]
MGNSTLDIKRLMEPGSVAIVGASANMESISGRPLKLLKRYNYKGKIYPVNPKYKEIDGLACYPDVASLPETPDVVLVGVRAELVPQVIKQSVQRGVPFAVIFSSGFAESDNQQAQDELIDIAKRGGTRILGPNCQGLVNFVSSIPLSFSASLDSDARPKGHVAYVSQSGAFGFASFAMAAERGVGFRYVVTTGNQADLDVIDFGMAFADDPEVRLLVMYMEGIKDGNRFIDLLSKARKRNLPVAVLKVGRSPTAQEAVRSHTAALAGDEAVWRTIFKQYGAIEIEDAQDIVDLGKIFGSPKRPKGRRLGILTTSGGGGIIMADRAYDEGLEVPELPDDAKKKIEEHIPPFGSSRNPVDLTAQVINEPEGFASSVEAVIESPNIDMVTVVVSMITGESGYRVAQDIKNIFHKSPKPFACCWLINREQGGRFLDYLREGGVPLFQSPRRCAWAMSKLYESSRMFEEEDEVEFERRTGVLKDYPARLTEYEAKQVLAAYGVPITRERLCENLNDALEAADEIGYPVALKVMSPDILHKTDAGVVALNLRSQEEVRNAYGRLMEKASKVTARENIHGVLIQEMVTGGLEFMIGVKRDELFGPIVAVGLGGIYVEVLKDVSLRRAPVSKKEAEKMIEELKGYPLLAGARGQNKKDIGALAEAIEKISILASIEEDLQELDANPVFVFDEGYGIKAIDAMILRRGPQ